MPFRDIREFMEFLRQRGELKVCKREVDPYIELAKVTDKATKVKGPAILFTNVKGFKTPVITGLFNTIDRAFLTIDSSKYDGFRKMARGLDKPIPIKIVKDAPCKEVIKKGRDIDLTAIPVPQHHKKDSHPLITAGTCRGRDPDTGVCNSSINRVAVQGRDWASIQSNPPHQLGVIMSKRMERREVCPVAITIGDDPATYALSACGIPYGMDEMTFVGGIKGEPVEMVRCETNDIEVPATAELVIEGEIRPGDESGYVGKTNYAEDAPFAEISGYFGAKVRSPVVYVTAVTHRKDYIYHNIGMAEPPSEHQLLNCFGMQADVFAAVRTVIPAELIKAINPMVGAAGWGIAISIKKKSGGQGKQLIYGLLARAGIKSVIIVDDDIDVFNDDEVWWAITFRAGADDYVKTVEVPMIGLDPMITRPPNLLAKVGIDATLPLNNDKPGKIEVLRELGPCKYYDLDKVNLADYIDYP